MSKLINTMILALSLNFTHAMANDEIIIKYKKTIQSHNVADKSAKHLQHLKSLSNINFQQQRNISGGLKLYKPATPLSKQEQADLITALNNDPTIEYAEINALRYPTFVPNDSHYLSQWALNDATVGINIEPAWDITRGDAGIVIAVIDTGSLAHADINGRYESGYDFVSTTGTDANGNLLDNDGTLGRDNDPSDPGDSVGPNDCGDNKKAQTSSWHGLSVSSVIAASSNNNNDIAGVNWGSKILPIRALGRCGGAISDINDAIRWAAGISDPALPPPPSTPAKVINLSLGGKGQCTGTEQDAIDDAIKAGAVVIAGAGNDKTNVSEFAPANCDNVIAVAATGLDGGLATLYSNYGLGITLAAPAGNGGSNDATLVLSNSGTTTPVSDNTIGSIGTSFATPFVSGVASLMLSIRPDLSPDAIHRLLINNVSTFPTGTSHDCTTSTCGAGIVNAELAIQAAMGEPLPGEGSGTIQFKTNAACVTEDNAALTVQVLRLNNSSDAVSVSYKTTNDSAIAYNDYTQRQGILRWADADSSSKTITIPIIDDNIIEAAETFSISLNETSANAILGSTMTAVTVTIQSNDSQPKLCTANTGEGGTFVFRNASQTVNENADSLTVHVSRTNNSLGDVSVEYATLDDQGTVSAGLDYISKSGTLFWASGDTSDKIINIKLIDNNLREANKNFSIALSRNTSTTLIGKQSTTSIIIESDEAPNNNNNDNNHNDSNSDNNVVATLGGGGGTTNFIWLAISALLYGLRRRQQ